MYLAGIDLGGSSIKAGLVDENMSLVCKSSRQTDVERGFSKVTADMADMVSQLAQQQDIALSQIKSIGIGLPGIFQNGIANAVNLFWKDVPLESEMKKHIDLPVFADNDATVAAVYEYHFGALKESNVGVLLTLGTGIGGGIIINGKPFNGAHGLGGELGHIQIVPDGLPCTCGNKGCLENYASATAMLRQGRRCVAERPESLLFKLTDGDMNRVTAKLVTDCAMQGDNIALALVDAYVGYLAVGIGIIENTLDPDTIALGGGVSNTGAFLLDKIIAACADKGVFTGKKYADIKFAVSGNDAGILGAAMLGVA